MGRLTPKEAEFHFRVLVLKGIWMLARIIVAPKLAAHVANDWRADALTYLDDQGNQHPDAPEHRRTREFPPIPNPTNMDYPHGQRADFC
jgi:hypothetical protein